MTFDYAAKGWDKERRFVARIEATAAGVDVRYVVSSLELDAKQLYETTYCARGGSENYIKWHKSQLASDRTSCRKPEANQFRLILHTRRLLAHARHTPGRPQALGSRQRPSSPPCACISSRSPPASSKGSPASASICPRPVQTLPSCAPSPDACAPPGHSRRGSLAAPKPPPATSNQQTRTILDPVVPLATRSMVHGRTQLHRQSLANRPPTMNKKG